MSIKSKVGTAAVIGMAMVFALVYADHEDAPAELDLASTACAEGEVPDGLGHCVACDTCRMYPDSPYCTLCSNPGKVTKTPDQWNIGLVIGIPAALVFVATLAAVLLYRLWYKRRQDEEQQMGQGNQGGALQIPVAPQIQNDEVRIPLEGEARRPPGRPVTIRAELETGEESAELSIPIQAEDAAAGDFAGTAPPTGQQQLQPSDEEMPLISHDDNAATVPK